MITEANKQKLFHFLARPLVQNSFITFGGLVMLSSVVATIYVLVELEHGKNNPIGVIIFGLLGTYHGSMIWEFAATQPWRRYGLPFIDFIPGRGIDFNPESGSEFFHRKAYGNSLFVLANTVLWLVILVSALFGAWEFDLLRFLFVIGMIIFSFVLFLTISYRGRK